MIITTLDVSILTKIFEMKKITAILFLLSCVHLSGQEIITLEYDNSGLDYREAEIKTKGLF
jgi:hypothetical protein